MDRAVGDAPSDVAPQPTEEAAIELADYERQLPAGSSLKRWVLFDGHRGVVATAVLAVLFVGFLATWATGYVAFRREGPATLLLSVFIAGNFTLVTIVIAINQLVLSREFGKPHSLRERDEGIRQLRRDVEAATGGGVAPAEPLAFVRTIVGTIHDHAVEIRDRATEIDDPELGETTVEYAETVATEADRLDAVLSEAQFASFPGLSAMLFFPSAWAVHVARQLRTELVDSSLDFDHGQFDTLEDVLRLFNVTRQYTKTLYMQEEVARLSRQLLYVGIVALVAPALVMLVYGDAAGTTVESAALPPVFLLATLASFAPLALLVAYVVRVSTVVSHMPLVGSFITDG